MYCRQGRFHRLKDRQLLPLQEDGDPYDYIEYRRKGSDELAKKQAALGLASRSLEEAERKTETKLRPERMWRK